jgi:hypothetical protein
MNYDIVIITQSHSERYEISTLDNKEYKGMIPRPE